MSTQQTSQASASRLSGATQDTLQTQAAPPRKKGAAPFNLSLLGFFFKRHRVLLIVIAVCVAAYSAMIVALWPLFIDEGLQETMEQLAAAIPGFDAEAFSMSLGQYLETQWLGVYWLPLAGAVLIALAAKAIAGGIADGTLETIFSAPLRRATFFGTLVLTIFLFSGILSIATIAPLSLLGPLFEAELSLETSLLLTLASWLILFVFGLIVMALSSWMRGVAAPAGIAVALILVMLVLYIATPYVEFLEVLQPLNLLHWWGSAALIDTGEVAAGLWIWLAVVGVVSLIVSYVRLGQRDLA